MAENVLKKEVWTTRASRDIKNLKDQIEKLGDLVKVKDANILKLTEELGNLRELGKENEERVHYLQKQVEKHEAWASETNEFKNVIMHEIKNLRERFILSYTPEELQPTTTRSSIKHLLSQISAWASVTIYTVIIINLSLKFLGLQEYYSFENIVNVSVEPEIQLSAESEVSFNLRLVLTPSQIQDTFQPDNSSLDNEVN